MKKTHTEKQEIEVTVVDDIICNVCGKSIMKGPMSTTDYIELNKTWGYFSNKDFFSQSADICEKCWDKFCETFVIPPLLVDLG